MAANALQEAFGYVQRLKDRAGGLAGGIANSFQNTANYFNPQVGVNTTRQFASPVPTKQVATPNIQNFWSNPAFGRVPKFETPYIGDAIAKMTPSAPPVVQGRPVVSGLGNFSRRAMGFAGDVARETLNSPQKLIESGVIGQLQQAQNALSYTGLTKPVPVQQQLGTMGQFANAALNLVPIGGAGAAKGAVIGLSKAGLKQAAIQGAKLMSLYGGAGGFTQGLYENRFAPTVKEQLGNSAANGVFSAILGIPLGAVTGMGGAVAGNAVRKIAGELMQNDPKLTESQAINKSFSFIRNKLGQFAGVVRKETGMIRDYQTDPLTATEKKILDQKYGWLTANKEGFARIPGAPKGVGGGGITSLEEKIKEFKTPQEFANYVESVGNDWSGKSNTGTYKILIDSEIAKRQIDIGNIYLRHAGKGGKFNPGDLSTLKEEFGDEGVAVVEKLNSEARNALKPYEGKKINAQEVKKLNDLLVPKYQKALGDLKKIVIDKTTQSAQKESGIEADIIDKFYHAKENPVDFYNKVTSSTPPPLNQGGINKLPDVKDLSGISTGWKQTELRGLQKDLQGYRLVNPKTGEVKDFPIKSNTGADQIRASAEAHAYAIDNPIQMREVGGGGIDNIVTKPLYEGSAPLNQGGKQIVGELSSWKQSLLDEWQAYTHPENSMVARGDAKVAIKELRDGIREKWGESALKQVEKEIGMPSVGFDTPKVKTTTKIAPELESVFGPAPLNQGGPSLEAVNKIINPEVIKQHGPIVKISEDVHPDEFILYAKDGTPFTGVKIPKPTNNQPARFVQSDILTMNKMREVPGLKQIYELPNGKWRLHGSGFGELNGTVVDTKEMAQKALSAPLNQGGIPKELQSLAEKVNKYRNRDEFVASQIFDTSLPGSVDKKLEELYGNKVTSYNLADFYNQVKGSSAPMALNQGGGAKVVQPASQVPKPQLKPQTPPAPTEFLKAPSSQVPTTETPQVPPVQKAKPSPDYNATADFEQNVLNGKPDIPLSSDAETVANAPGKTMLGNEGQGGIGGLVPDVKKAFQDWVNTQRARFVEGTIKGKEFADLDNKGMDGIFEFQAGDKSGRFADVKKYFDAKRQAVIDSGIDINYKRDYLPQIWANTQEEVQKVFGSTLSKRPSFSLESVIADYQTGIQAGLKPRFQNISQLVGWYESHANKAIADANFFKFLSKEGIIQPASKAPFGGWTTLSPDRFPKLKVTTGEGNYVGTYKAPDNLAKMINNYLEAPRHETLARIADFASTSKNRMLSFGIPGTAINAHGFNILFRNTVSSLSHGDIGGVVNGFKYMLNPRSAGQYVQKEMTKAPFAIKHGLTLSSSEYKSLLDEAPTTLRGKVGQTWNTAFEKGLFDEMIPALKLQNFYKVFEGYKKSGMKEYEAAKAAATFTNDVFGGINWAELGRSKDTQNLMRSLILAPDWFETNINMAKKLPQSVTTGLTNPAMSAYRKFAAAFMATYAGLNVVNKISSGHWMFQNEPGHAFEIEMGETSDGQKRYIRPMGTAADFVRLPVDVAIGLQKGDFTVVNRIIRNRLSTIAGSAYSIATDTDYAGNPIGVKGTDRWGRPMSLKERVAGVAGQVGNIAGFPAFAQRGLGYATGSEGGEQALLQGLEMPVRYAGNRMRPPSVEDETLSYTVKEDGKIKTKTMSLKQPLPGFETKYGVNSTAAKILQESQFMNKDSSITKQQAADLLKKLGADAKISVALAKRSVQTKQIDTLKTAYKIRAEYYKMPVANRKAYLQSLKDKGILTPEVVAAIKGK